MSKRNAHLALAHSYWKEHLNPGDIVVDATAGNGHDTLELLKIGCIVHSLDIQKAALDNTRARVHSFDPKADVSYYLQCHSVLPNLKFKAVIYNFGYLPGGDKALTSKVDTSLKSLNTAWAQLDENGFLSITCYPGHAEGAKELEVVTTWVQEKPHKWLVPPNERNAPALLLVSKS